MLSTTTTISHLITRSSDLDNCVDWLYNPLERERERERDGGYLEDNSLECHVCLTLNSRVYFFDKQANILKKARSREAYRKYTRLQPL